MNLRFYKLMELTFLKIVKIKPLFWEKWCCENYAWFHEIILLSSEFCVNFHRIGCLTLQTGDSFTIIGCITAMSHRTYFCLREMNFINGEQNLSGCSWKDLYGSHLLSMFTFKVNDFIKSLFNRRTYET